MFKPIEKLAPLTGGCPDETEAKEALETWRNIIFSYMRIRDSEQLKTDRMES